jgi:NAD(P)H-hydrate epimerase
VIPIVTPEEMGAIDAAAPEPVEVLIGRAGSATAWAALRLLGGSYGRRVVVIAGRGNNGNDGRDAAARLRRRGVRAQVLDATDLPSSLPRSDLVIDAAYGTGFRGEWSPPDVGSAPVLAVDIPSGVLGLTGEVPSGALRAVHTVTFAALKPGLLLEPGASLAGEVEVADIGLDVSGARAHLVTDGDVAGWVPPKAVDTHKWRSAVWVIGGSPGLEGAAVLTSRAATRAGAGYVRWSSPGEVPALLKPTEVVGTAIPERAWADAVLGDAGRFGALAVGNGLGLDDRHRESLLRVVAESPIPVVVDADALTLLGDRAVDACRSTTILTPHDGEYARLAGHPPGADRLDAARTLASATGAVVLLKGPTTIVAAPGGSVLACRSGDARLATLGSGDVLAGVIAALCARGVAPFEAAAAAAHLHGRAGRLGWRHGVVATDLVERLPLAFDAVLTPL